jgi:hypothetical protein
MLTAAARGATANLEAAGYLPEAAGCRNAAWLNEHGESRKPRIKKPARERSPGQAVLTLWVNRKKCRVYLRMMRLAGSTRRLWRTEAEGSAIGAGGTGAASWAPPAAAGAAPPLP